MTTRSKTPPRSSRRFGQLNEQAASLAGLFDFIENLQFWVKDAAGCYRAVNRGFLFNYSLTSVAEAVGKTDYDFSPDYIASQFRLDDERVLGGEAVLNRVEMVGRFDHTAVWCVTNKLPLRDARGRIIGTAGITHPLTANATETVGGDLAIARVLARLRERPADPHNNATLARCGAVRTRV